MPYLKGTGTSVDPYILYDYSSAKTFFEVDVFTVCYAELIADIDLQGITFTQNNKNCYANLNGNGFCLSNLNCSNLNAQPAKWYGYLKHIKLLDFKNPSDSNHWVFDFNKNCENVVFEQINYPAFYTGRDANSSIISCFAKGLITIDYWSSLVVVTNCYVISGTFKKATAVLSGDIYKAESYTGLSNTYWIKDGASLPRLLKSSVSNLSLFYAVKGKTLVGSIPKSRKCRCHAPTDFNQISSVTSATDGSYILPCLGYTDHVYVTHSEEYGYKLQSNKIYILGDVIHPVTPNGYRYKCTTAGTSAATLPSEPWPTSSNLVSGTAIFTPEPIYKTETFLVVPRLYNLLTGQPA